MILHTLSRVGIAALLTASFSSHAWFGPFGGNSWSNPWGGNNNWTPWNNNAPNYWNGPYAPAPWGYNGAPYGAVPYGAPPVAPGPGPAPVPWANNNNTPPWQGNLPWKDSPWSKNPWGNMSGPWDNGPWNNNWSGGPWNTDFFDNGPGEYFDPADPRGSMAKMWDDMLEAPNEMGEMPGGWTAPNIKVPNPVEVGDEFEGTSRQAPGEAADQLNNFRFN